MSLVGEGGVYLVGKACGSTWNRLLSRLLRTGSGQERKREAAFLVPLAVKLEPKSAREFRYSRNI